MRRRLLPRSPGRRAAVALLLLAVLAGMFSDRVGLSKVVAVVPKPVQAAAPTASPRAAPEDSPQRVPASPMPSPQGPCLNVPVLYYHYIRVNPVVSDKAGFKLSVTPANFAAQMALLHADGAHTATLADVVAALESGAGLPPRTVVLTFDDGHDDFATRAVPVLLRYDFTATAFVVPGFLGRPSYMTAAQVQQVAAAGFTIGAHTLHHVDLPAKSAAVAEVEIEASRTQLQSLTGQPVLDFAYPYGRYNAAVVKLVEAAGFRDAVTTDYGYGQCLARRFALHRVEVTGSDSLATFARRASVPYVPETPSPSARP